MAPGTGEAWLAGTYDCTGAVPYKLELKDGTLRLSQRLELSRTRDPMRKVRLLEAFGREVATGSREAAEAFERLKREALRLRGRLDPEEILNLLLERGKAP